MQNKNRIIIAVCAILGVTGLIWYLKPEYLTDRLDACWNNIWCASVISIGVFIVVVYREKDLFAPFVISSFLLFALFIYAPLMCIISGDLYAVGNVDVFDGCIKATWIYVITYLAFSYGYTIRKKIVLGKKKIVFNKSRGDKVQLDANRKVNTAVAIWGGCLLMALIYDVSRGVSLTYIFSYGLIGNSGGGQSLNNSLAILGNFAYALVACWLYVLEYSRNKFLILVIGLITGSIYFTRGFRFIMIIMILAPIILYYLNAEKRPKIINTVLVVVGLIIFAGLIEVSRGAIRAGIGGLNMKYSPIELMNRVFMSDFTIFKQFYGMVMHIPRDLGYKFGQEMFLYTIIMMVPRGLWPGKPDFPYREVLEISISKQAVTAGQAWPILGAFYFEFGILGCIFFMFILGYAFSRIYRKIRYQNVSVAYFIGYSIFLPTIMQIICRGCIPQQVYLLLFSFLPIFLIENLMIRI